LAQVKPAFTHSCAVLLLPFFSDIMAAVSKQVYAEGIIRRLREGEAPTLSTIVERLTVEFPTMSVGNLNDLDGFDDGESAFSDISDDVSDSSSDSDSEFDLEDPDELSRPWYESSASTAPTEDEDFFRSITSCSDEQQASPWLADNAPVAGGAMVIKRPSDRAPTTKHPRSKILLEQQAISLKEGDKVDTMTKGVKSLQKLRISKQESMVPARTHTSLDLLALGAEDEELRELMLTARLF